MRFIKLMVSVGYARVRAYVRGCVLVCASLCGFAKMYVNFCGCAQVCVGVCGCARVCTGVRGCAWSVRMGVGSIFRISSGESLHQRTLIRILYKFFQTIISSQVGK